MDIEVYLTWDGQSRILTNNGVTAGPGVELSAANERVNPDDWFGSVTVDVDPVTQTVAVATEEYDFFSSISVRIASPDMVTFTAGADTLWELPSALTRTTSVGGGVAKVAWTSAAPMDVRWLAAGGKAVFGYETRSSLAAVSVSGSATSATHTVRWSPTTGNGVALPTKYLVTVRRGVSAVYNQMLPAGARSVVVDRTRLKVPGTYTATVRSHDSNGTSAEIAKTFTVKAIAPAAAAKVKVGGTKSAAKRTVSWVKPAWDGGTKVTGYKITVYKGKKKLTSTTVTAGKRSVKVKTAALTSGTLKVVVQAKNAKGYGAKASATFKVKK